MRKLGDFLKFAKDDIDDLLNEGNIDKETQPSSFTDNVSDQDLQTLVSDELMRAKPESIDDVFRMLSLHLRQPYAEEPSSSDKIVFIAQNLGGLNKDQLNNIYNILSRI